MIQKRYFLVFYILLCILRVSAQDSFIVVIDAGHGGHDPGALGAVSKEKKINLDVALKLGSLIEKNNKDVKVIYTRKNDKYLTLFERAELANKNKANLFISIHANGAKNNKVAGTETFTFGLSKSKSNLDVAMRENSVILLEDDYKTTYQGFDPTSVESYIMFEFMQNKYMDQSIELASYIQDHFVKDCRRQNRGVKQSELIVLHRSACPGVLVELGFISNAEEERYMNSAKGQNELAKAIYSAFSKYKHNYDKKSLNAVSNRTAGREARDDIPVFKVQFCSSKNKLKSNDSRLKGISSYEYYVENGLYKYTTGNSSDYNKIVKIRNEIKAKFPDAFIIAFQGENKIPAADALKILENK